MKAFSLITILLSTIVLCSCSSQSPKEDIPVFLVSTNSVGNKEWILGAPNGLAVFNEWLVINDSKSTAPLHFIDINKEIYIGLKGEYGQGPNEMGLITSLCSTKEQGIVCYDPNRRILYKIDSDTIKSVFQTNKDVFFHQNVYPLKGKKYLSAGIYPEKPFCILDSIGNVQSIFGDFPYRDPKEQEAPGEIKSQVYQMKISLSPSAERFVAYSLWGGFLEFYQTVTDTPSIVKKEHLYYPEYRYESGIYQGASRSNEVTYLDATASDDHVLLLYSGKTMQNDGLKAFTGDRIFVYNWDGEKIAELKTDKQLKCLSLSTDGKSVYAIALDPEPILVKTLLPNEIR